MGRGRWQGVEWIRENRTFHYESNATRASLAWGRIGGHGIPSPGKEVVVTGGTEKVKRSPAGR